jgi:hypothetical protein
MNTVTFPYKVRRVLTTDDMLRIGSEMATAEAKLEQLGEELKEIKDGYKSRSSAAETTIQRCQRAINNGWQMADVPCYWQMDHPHYGLKSIIRTDTAEVVQSEPMEDCDRQRVLEFQTEPEQSSSDSERSSCTIAFPDGTVLQHSNASDPDDVAIGIQEKS